MADNDIDDDTVSRLKKRVERLNRRVENLNLDISDLELAIIQAKVETVKLPGM